MLRRVIGTASANALIALMGLASGVLAARVLGAEGRGLMAAVQTLPLAIGAMSTLGLPDAVTFHLASGTIRARQAFWTALGLSLASGVALASAASIALPHYYKRSGAPPSNIAFEYLLIIPLTGLLNVSMGALRGRGKLGLWNALRIVPGLCWLAALVGATLWKLSLAELLRVQLLCLFGMGVFCLLPVIACDVGKPSLDRASASSLLKYGLPLMIAAAPQLVGVRIDQLWLAATMPAGRLGLYSVMATYGGLSGLLVSAIGQVAMPLLAGSAESAEQKRLVRVTITAAVFLTTIGGTALLLAAPLVVPVLFGREFTGAFAAAWPVVLVGALVGLSGVMCEVLRGLRAPVQILRIEATAAAVSVAGLLLLPTGTIEAALSVLAGQALAVGLYLRAVARISGGSIRSLVPTPKDFTAMASRIRSIRSGSSVLQVTGKEMKAPH